MVTGPGVILSYEPRRDVLARLRHDRVVRRDDEQVVLDEGEEATTQVGDRRLVEEDLLLLEARDM